MSKNHTLISSSVERFICVNNPSNNNRNKEFSKKKIALLRPLGKTQQREMSDNKQCCFISARRRNISR